MTESELGDRTGDAIIEKSVGEVDLSQEPETEQTEVELRDREILEDGDPQKLTTANRSSTAGDSVCKALVPYVDADEIREETLFWHTKQARIGYLKAILQSQLTNPETLKNLNMTRETPVKGSSEAEHNWRINKII